jgi:hypothetical protein
VACRQTPLEADPGVGRFMMCAACHEDIKGEALTF